MKRRGCARHSSMIVLRKHALDMQWNYYKSVDELECATFIKMRITDVKWFHDKLMLLAVRII